MVLVSSALLRHLGCQMEARWARQEVRGQRSSCSRAHAQWPRPRHMSRSSRTQHARPGARMRTVEDRKERGERSWPLSGLTTYFVWLLPMSPLYFVHLIIITLVSYRVVND